MGGMFQGIVVCCCCWEEQVVDVRVGEFMLCKRFVEALLEGRS